MREMILEVLPEGITSSNYFPLIAALYDELADGHIAAVVSVISGKDYGEVLNDIYKVGSSPHTPGHVDADGELTQEIRALLAARGLFEM
jgi:hypothetical protein